MNEICLNQFQQRKAELLEALEAFRRVQSYFFSVLLVTDVNSQSSLLLVTGDPRFTEGIYYPRLEPGIYELKNIISRKKQLLPYLAHQLQQLRQ